MNSSKKFKEKLYIIMCINGVISKDAINLLDGSYKYKAKVMSNLRKDKIVMTKDKITSFWHIEWNRNKWEKYVGNEYVEIAKKRINVINSASPTDIHRLSRQSELMAFLLESGVEITVRPIEKEPYFIPSRDIKELLRINDISADKSPLSFSRANGTYVTENTIYVVYNLTLGSIPIKEAGEREYQRISAEITGKKEGPPVTKDVPALVFLQNLSCLDMFLKDFKKDKGTQFLKLGKNYEKMYFLPFNAEGQYILRLLDRIPSEAYKKALLDGEEKRGEKTPKEVLFENGKEYHYNFLVPELGNLYKVYLMSKYDSDHIHIVHCYKEYEEGVRKVAPSAQIVTHTLPEILNKMLI